MPRKGTGSKQVERAESIEQLRKWFPVGSTVYTILRSASRSGMSREIGVVAIQPDGQAWHPNYHVAQACDYRLGKGDGVKVGGCGMDMGFALAYNISATIWPTYQCAGEKCMSPDHHGNQGNAPRDGTVTHKDGYALAHRWL
jgi:hypothetical protein